MNQCLSSLLPHNENLLSEALESLNDVGYVILPNLLSQQETKLGIEALYNVQTKILSEVSLERLRRADEEGVFRLPMKFDPIFYRYLEQPNILALVDATVSNTSILHLQNGFIFPAHQRGDSLDLFQYQFHRDFPRDMNGYVASINVLLTFTDLTEDSEGFYVVPKSQQKSTVFTQDYCKDHAVPVVCPAGSALIFDSTLWHSAGPNYSSQNWIGVNHQFTRAFIKQQIDYVRALGNDVIEKQVPRTQQLLGWYSRVVTSLDEYYQPENKRLYRKGQG